MVFRDFQSRTFFFLPKAIANLEKGSREIKKLSNL